MKYFTEESKLKNYEIFACNVQVTSASKKIDLYNIKYGQTR